MSRRLVEDVTARSGAAPAPAKSPSALGVAAALVTLQAQAGNRAVAVSLQASRRLPAAPRPLPVQRCGPVPCDCSPEERLAKESAPAVQRQQAEPAPPGPAARPPDGAQTGTAASCPAMLAEEDWTAVRAAAGGKGYPPGAYYRDVARVLIEAAEDRGVDFNRSLFVVAQAQAEQGLKDPGTQRWRVLNMQPALADAQTATPDPAHPGLFVLKDGHRFTWLCSPEDGAACTHRAKVAPGCEPKLASFQMTPTQCLVKSPFFVYDNLQDQLDHYLAVQGARRPDVVAILKGAAGHEHDDIRTFGAALTGYGTDKRYSAKLCGQYNQVVRDMHQVLDHALDRKARCLTDAQQEVAKGWDALNHAKDERARAEAAAGAAPDDGALRERLRAATAEVARLEAALHERELALQAIEKDYDAQVKTLTERRQSLVEVPC